MFKARRCARVGSSAIDEREEWTHTAHETGDLNYLKMRHTPIRGASAPADAGVEIAWERADEFGAPTLEH